MPLSLMPRTTGRRKDPQPLLQRDGVQNAQGRHLYAAFGHFELRVGPLLHFGRLHPVLRLPLLRAIRPSRPGRRLAQEPRGRPMESKRAVHCEQPETRGTCGRDEARPSQIVRGRAALRRGRDHDDPCNHRPRPLLPPEGEGELTVGRTRGRESGGTQRRNKQNPKSLSLQECLVQHEGNHSYSNYSVGIRKRLVISFRYHNLLEEVACFA